MDFKKFADEKLTNSTTKKSYTATYNSHLSQFENDDAVITEEQIPKIMEYIKNSNRRQSTKNCMLVILTRMMLHNGIEKSLTTDIKQQFNSISPQPSVRSEIEKYIERLYKCGNIKSYVINTILFNHDVSEEEMKELFVVDSHPTIRDSGVYVRPNYVTIQSKHYPQFKTHGMKKIRIHSSRCRDFLEQNVNKLLLDVDDSISNYTMNGMTKQEYEDNFLDGLTGSKRSEYLKYR